MDALFWPKTRNNTGSRRVDWWTVDEVAIDPQLTVYYQLGRRDVYPADRRDAKRRTPLEAFASLPFAEMTGALEGHRLGLAGQAGEGWQSHVAWAVVSPFTDFLKTFGPAGIGWGMTFEVANPEVDRVRRQLLPAIGSRKLARGVRESWRVSFWGHGPGRSATPEVRRVVSYPAKTFQERAQLGDHLLPHDLWSRLVDEHRDLRTALDIVEAIARRRQIDCRDLVRPLVGDQAEFWTGEPDRFDSDFRGAYRRTQWSDEERVRLLSKRANEVDWIEVARQTVAGLIRRQIDFAMPAVFARDYGFDLSWRATSLLEVIYLELLDHLRRRPESGVAWCVRCRGPILRTRWRGQTANKWHSGCQAGRMEEWRHGKSRAKAVRDVT